jgi:hypothetical protein
MVRPLTSFQAPDVVVDVAGEIDLKVVAPVGPRGPQGLPGSSVLYGFGPPQSTVGADGDFYINTDVFALYGPKAGGSWPAGISLIGPQGAPGGGGPPGADGRTVLNGNSPPDSSTGANGDFYIDTLSDELYGPKASGLWPSGVPLIGPQGIEGPEGPLGVRSVTERAHP